MTHQVFPTIRTIITKDSRTALVKDIFLVVVVRCTSAILYNLIAMWHLVLAFMLKSYVCIVALNSPSPFIRRCDRGGGGYYYTVQCSRTNAPGQSIYYFVFVVVLYLFIHLFFLFFINYPDMAWLRQQGLSNYYIIFYSLSIFSKISFSGWQR